MESQDEVFIYTILEIVKNILEVAQLQRLEFNRGWINYHIEKHKRCNYQENVQENFNVNRYGLFEEKSQHKFISCLTEVDH